MAIATLDYYIYNLRCILGNSSNNSFSRYQYPCAPWSIRTCWYISNLCISRQFTVNNKLFGFFSWISWSLIYKFGSMAFPKFDVFSECILDIEHNPKTLKKFSKPFASFASVLTCYTLWFISYTPLDFVILCCDGTYTCHLNLNGSSVAKFARWLAFFVSISTFLQCLHMATFFKFSFKSFIFMI